MSRRTKREGQVPTRRVTDRKVMSRPAFELGVADVRAGMPYRSDYDSWPCISDQWDYERGRLWARLTPHHVQLKRGGKLTDEALEWCQRHGTDII
jgi:hypothetical protein